MLVSCRGDFSRTSERIPMSDAPLDEVHACATRLAELAREEDLGAGDVTSALLPTGDERAEFRLVAREPLVFAGQVIAADVLGVYGSELTLSWNRDVADGARIGEAGMELARIVGPYASVLTAERVLLNFLQRLCGIATLTRAYVDAVAGTGAKILDTRKTTPGWRALEKYAVRCGGGCNHRMGLYDAVLIKDNHLAGVAPDRLAGFVFDLLNRITERPPRPSFVEVEVDSLEQLEQLLKVVGIDVILLDNFPPERLRDAVQLRNSSCPDRRVALEASGGITLETVRAMAETGVERISIGALTHSSPAADLALERVG